MLKAKEPCIGLNSSDAGLELGAGGNGLDGGPLDFEAAELGSPLYLTPLVT